jgi:ABC-type nitrate/sulfonate/bicarbonate transport system permease component
LHGVSIAIFPITVNTYAGIRDVRGSMLEIGRAYGATEWQIFSKIIMPAAIPFIMAGIRLAVGLAIIGIIVAEFFTAISGLGGMIVEYANVFANREVVRTDHRHRTGRRGAHRARDVAGAADVALAAARAGAVLTPAL